MKKLTLSALLLCAVALFASCSKDDDCKDPGTNQSRWGKPLAVIHYTDDKGTSVQEITNYSYDQWNRLVGYRRTSSLGFVQEEMVNSSFSGNIHTYEVHSYEWSGTSLPVVFLHTDTYTDNSFSTLEKQVEAGQNMDYKQTITYTYENGTLTGYSTVEEGAYPEIFETQVIYKHGIPTEGSFPGKIQNEALHQEIVYADDKGNQTGYYTDNDYGRTQWNYKYGDGFCTFLQKKQYGPTAQLVRVVFYPEKP